MRAGDAAQEQARRGRRQRVRVMTAQMLAFPEQRDEREALLQVLPELHALIAIDPIMGASPVRILFVLNPQARGHVVACIDPADIGARDWPVYALIAYNFPYALHQFGESLGHICNDRAKAIVTCSAALQSDAFQRAAAALGIVARPIASFDAPALKTAVFPRTQETITHLFRLAPASARAEANWS